MVLMSFLALLQDPATAALIGLGAALPVLLAVVLSTRSKTSDVKKPHRLPTTLPVLGNLVDLVKNEDVFHDWLTSLCAKYEGEPFSVEVAGLATETYIYTPPLVEEIMKIKFDTMPKGPVLQDNFRDLLGHGIFAVDGPKWVHQRKTASNLFTARALRDTMTESMRRYAVVLERILNKARDSGEPIDLFKLMNKFTIEAFAKMGFGIDINCLESEVDHPFQNAFDSSQRMMVFRFLRPAWFWKLQRLLGIGAEGQLKKDIAVVDKTVMEIVAQSLERRHQQGGMNKATGGGDIVSLFLDRFDDSTGEQFDPTYLRDIVVNFLIAGRDTTAQAMSWCFYNLGKNPDVVSKIRAEVAEHLPDFANGSRTEPPTMEEVQHFTYLEATLKETLRLHPSVPGIPKSVAEDTVLSDGTFLAAGSSISIPTYAMGRMEFIWGPDAKQFKPDRWIDPATGKIRNESQFKFVAFNAGPRICLGMNLAMLEMKIVLASVVTHFNVELVTGQHITYENSLTLPIKGQLLARVTSV